MSRKYASSPHRKDDNEAEIVAALEKIGCRVYDKLPVDLLVECRGRWFLVECKNPLGLNRTTKRQDEFFEITRAPAGIARDAEGAIELVTRRL